ncbi:MAG: hypothetical protein IT380_19470 [Myxococcales bacterium]|nr:hypothetical protein [Myxococcales bacterium]
MALTPPRPEDTRPPATWRPHLVVGVVMFLLALRLLSWHWQGSAPGRHLTPRAEHLTNAGLIALPVMPAAALVWMAARRKLRMGLTLGAVGLILAGGVASGGFLYATFNLFGPTHQLSVPSPDGAKVAHVYVGGLLGCDAALYVAPSWEMVAEAVANQRVDCGAEVQVEWQPDGTAELRAPPPTPILFGH